MNQKALENLNPEQLKAVNHYLGPILVLAGAGTGKTRVLTHRVANLILNNQVKPYQILAVTFTNKATNEMRERLNNLLGSNAKDIWIATFHSASLRILRRCANHLGYTNNFVIYDTQDSNNVIKNILKNEKIETKYKPSFFLNQIDSIKNSFISSEDYEPDKTETGYLIAKIYKIYQEELKKADAMDFTDLIFNCLLLLETNPEIRQLYQKHFKFVLVDEFQDTNIIQYKIVRHLAYPENNLLVVGDDDQSIYAFRGADIRNILSFEKDFPKTEIVTLEQNYRSTQNILDAAYSVISKNKKRKEKKVWTEKVSGDLIKVYCADCEQEEARYIIDEIKENLKISDFSKIAIFYRTNAQSRVIEEALIHNKIPYKIFGGMKFYDRMEIKDILAYLRIIHNKKDNQAFIRIINTPKRGIGGVALNNLVQYSRTNNCSYFEALEHLNNTNKNLEKFYKIICEFRELANVVYLSELINLIVEKTEYLKMFEGDSDPRNQDRKENILELISIANQYDDNKNALTEFLDKVSLTSSGDNETSDAENEKNFVSLMTLHIAKGLEFPIVFLTGLEEGLIPHSRSIDEGDISEERRLCYVGITRAMEKLYLTYALDRGFINAGASFGFGGFKRGMSRFLEDLPNEVLHFENDFEQTDLYSDDDQDLLDVDLSFDDPYIEKVLFPKKKKKKNNKNNTIINIKNLIKTADEF